MFERERDGDEEYWRAGVAESEFRGRSDLRGARRQKSKIEQFAPKWGIPVEQEEQAQVEVPKPSEFHQEHACKV